MFQTHGVFQCPEVSGPVEANELYEKETGKKVIKPVLAGASGKKITESSAAILCTVMDVIETRITPDSAAEVSVVTEKLLDALQKAGSKLERQYLPKLSAVIGIGDNPVLVRSKVKLDLRFQTPGSWQEIWDMEDADEDRSRSLVRELAYSGSAHIPKPTAEELQLQEEEDCACFPDLEDTENKMIKRRKIKDVQNAAATREYLDQLGTILVKYRDVFRVKIGNDPLVDMPPMEITLKPGAVPKHVTERLRLASVFGTRGAGGAHPHIVRKPGVGNFRMTVDVKLADERVEQVVWSMPIILDFAMAAHCQDIYSILTEDGVVTPTRVLMEGTNSVAYVQSTVQAMFAEVFNNDLLIWIDDLLGYEANDEQLLKLLVHILNFCASKGLKLNPTKCAFYLREALWCGRVVSGEGVKHDPARIEALMSLPPPTLGSELQQFNCAPNWMRSSLPAYNNLVHPLVLQMEEV
ncbi:Hypothetical protein PHPALM_11460 [Phytophthora palmivora]|uniref:Reverse transcriptase domain-containing protein n=1 Tax=Phytophthora palmivora TaxID=4796 RepID=A0A2P4Y285_9STRA|nr:Hypothetical protein PHPALM_11460 [Phytophthora palmivora]